MVKLPTVVAIIHSYMPDLNLDPFLNEVVQAFVTQGVKLHLIRANDLVDNLGARNLNKSISPNYIADYINDINPAFIFTTNRAGITKEIMQKTTCPIINWMVDLIPFMHHGGNQKNLFCERDHIITSTLRSVEKLELEYPIVKGKVHYLPLATNIKDFQVYKKSKQDLNISFIGTYFYCGQLNIILQTYKEHPYINDSILKLCKKVEEDYNLDMEHYIHAYKLKKVLADYKLDIPSFKGLIANAISLNNRIKYLDVVSDLGLKLWGTDNWVEAGAFSLKLLSCFQFNDQINTRIQLIDIYQRSKIALNISHHQAQDGLPYRIFDILASQSLLITDYREQSDLFYLFGNDIPIPMYKNPAELRKLVLHFLNHEDERSRIVQYCNSLIEKGFAFEDRIVQLFEISGNQLGHLSTKGDLVIVPPNAFEKKRVEASPPLKKSPIIELRVYKDKSNHSKRMHLTTSSSRSNVFSFPEKAIVYITYVTRITISNINRLIIRSTTGSTRMSFKRYFRWAIPDWLKEKLKKYFPSL